MHSSSAISTSLPVDPSWRIGIVASSFHPEHVQGLIDGARQIFRSAGLAEEKVTIHPAAGAFEIPLIGAALAQAKSVDALLGLGVIVEGETHHARLLAESVAHGMMDVQVTYRIPFAFEVLYVQNITQALERCAGEQNKGAEAAIAVLHSLAQLQGLRS